MLNANEYKDWLEPTDGKGWPSTHMTKLDATRKFTIPNVALFTQSALFVNDVAPGQPQVLNPDLTRFVESRRTALINGEYKKQGYMIRDQFPHSDAGNEKEEVIQWLKDKDIYVWAHYGHGVAEVPGNVLFFNTEAGRKVMGRPAEFVPHHKLREIVIYVCQGGVKKNEWLAHVAVGGTLWSTEKNITTVAEGGWISLGKEYAPLSAVNAK
jgi:hypothetical protein